MKWEILNNSNFKDNKSLINSLLKSRGIKTNKDIDEFINPKDPEKIKITDLGVTKLSLAKVLKRLEKAKDNKEKVVIFGDYDADGVCATAIMWEALHKLGYDVMPYIPDRFVEGYGIKKESFNNPKLQNLDAKLIVTVDNGIVANNAVKEAKKLGIDVIILDHHTKGLKKPSTDYILHSTLVCGSALVWLLSKELGVSEGLDLATIGTIADQMQLLNFNRCIVKYGLRALNRTKRIGLKSIFNEARIKNIGVYEVGYIIAPRINAMGRLSNALEALRLLCTKDQKRAIELAKLLSETNIQRQKIVDDVLSRTLEEVKEDERLIVIDGEYHEGVIGLASGRVTEKFYKPSIVISRQDKISKASARSISGFNIIEAIKGTRLILEGGGHPMAAGFSIETKRIQEFRLRIAKITKSLLTDNVLERKLKIDTLLSFENINDDLIKELKKFEPTGYGNFPPVFITKNVQVVESKVVGSDGKHLKLKLSKNNIIFDAIYFGGNSEGREVKGEVDVAYIVEENVWNSKKTIQLKIKDLHTTGKMMN